MEDIDLYGNFIKSFGLYIQSLNLKDGYYDYILTFKKIHNDKDHVTLYDLKDHYYLLPHKRIIMEKFKIYD